MSFLHIPSSPVISDSTGKHWQGESRKLRPVPVHHRQEYEEWYGLNSPLKTRRRKISNKTDYCGRLYTDCINGNHFSPSWCFISQANIEGSVNIKKLPFWNTRLPLVGNTSSPESAPIIFQDNEALWNVPSLTTGRVMIVWPFSGSFTDIMVDLNPISPSANCAWTVRRTVERGPKRGDFGWTSKLSINGIFTQLWFVVN